MNPSESESTLAQMLKASAAWIFGFVILIWGIELVNLLLGHGLNMWGIRPRVIAGLPGIVLAPFLHNGFRHVLVNTMPFVVLGWLVMLRGTRPFLEVSAAVVLLSGAATWLLGRAGPHVGASGLIFGYFGFLVARGWFERSLSSILIALLTILLYGGMFWGLLPIRAYISWELHLFGLLAGIFVAWLLPSQTKSPTSDSSTDADLWAKLDKSGG